MPWFMGIDIGSVTSKGVTTEDGKQKAYHLLTCTITSGLDLMLGLSRAWKTNRGLNCWYHLNLSNALP